MRRRGRKSSPVPERLEEARTRFERWRSTRKHRRIPEDLWSLATELAGQFGVHRTARVLRLNDDSLRKRLSTGGGRRTTVANEEVMTSPFVELLSSPIARANEADPDAEATIELEDGSGRRLTIHLKGGRRVDPDLAALTSKLWCWSDKQ